MCIVAAKGADGELLSVAFSEMAMEPGYQISCDVCAVAAAAERNAGSCSARLGCRVANVCCGSLHNHSLTAGGLGCWFSVSELCSGLGGPNFLRQ